MLSRGDGAAGWASDGRREAAVRSDLLRIPSAIIPLSINFNSTNKKPNKSGIMSSGVFYERAVVKKAGLTFWGKGASINHPDGGGGGLAGTAEPRDSRSPGVRAYVKTG